MTYRPDENVKWIVIHYSATPIERDVSAADIDAMHKKRGFKEIGYHKYIRKSGLVEKGRDLDQPGRFEQGAHSKGENAASIGVCFEGGVSQVDPDKGYDTRTPEQIASMIRVIDDLLMRYPNAKVVGHRDMPGAATQCPGFDASSWWEDVVKYRKKPRTSPVQSKTLQASAVSVGGAAGTAFGALSGLDEYAQYIILGFAGLVVLATLFIMRERLKKWADGDR